jgi:carboxylesterase type B
MATNEDAAARPVVEVACGRLLGSRVGRLYAFRGVPYAIADRFAPPQPVPALTGIREAVRPGPMPSAPVSPRNHHGAAEAKPPDVGGVSGALDLLARSQG